MEMTRFGCSEEDHDPPLPLSRRQSLPVGPGVLGRRSVLGTDL